MIESIIVFVLAILASNLYGIHKISQGHVGLYRRFGIFSPVLTQPGYNFMFPFFSSFDQIQINVQTDLVTNIACGTSGGVLIQFQKIEIVNRLKKQFVYETVKNYSVRYDKLWIYDKIHHEINQFCSKHTLQQIYIQQFDSLDEELVMALNRDLNYWAPGIQIISVRVTKPKIPDSIKANFQEMQKMKVNYLIKSQQQRIKQQQQMTRQKQQVIKAESTLEVTAIQLEKALFQKQNQFKIAEIESLMHLEKHKALTQATFYNAQRQLETIKELLTEEYLQLAQHDALTANLTLILGDQIPMLLSKL